MSVALHDPHWYFSHTYWLTDGRDASRAICEGFATWGPLLECSTTSVLVTHQLMKVLRRASLEHALPLTCIDTLTTNLIRGAWKPNRAHDCF